ncbi:MAG: hypothetical protein GQ474_05350 [Sulfurimonas sp.]|nr:hypothetical protein [Sulfurimonas sp.]
MRYILTILLLVGFAQADIMKKKTLACPTIFQLKKAPSDTTDDSMSLSMYAIANDCVIIDKRDNIEAIGYDPTNSKEIYQKILYKKTGVYLYVLRSAIQVEQDGKKGSMRF